MKMSRARKTYLNRVGAALLCPSAAKRAILRQLGEDADAYLTEHPDADAETLAAALGAPEAFGEDYLASLETEQMQAMIRRAKLRKRIVIAVCCGLLVVLLVWSAFLIIRAYYDTKGVTLVDTFSIVERIEDDATSESTESEAVSP